MIPGDFNYKEELKHPYLAMLGMKKLTSCLVSELQIQLQFHVTQGRLDSLDVQMARFFQCPFSVAESRLLPWAWSSGLHVRLYAAFQEVGSAWT